VGFIDDDNIPAPDWAQRALEAMNAHPDAGAIGGFNEADLPIDPPTWFSRFAGLYAVGPQGPAEGGDVTRSRGFLWGAGLCVRRAAFDRVRMAGFSPMATGRTGGQFHLGDDTEICLVLRIAGWRLWYEPKLRLRHRIAETRLSWRYLCARSRADGASSVLLDPYQFALAGAGADFRVRLARRWGWRFLAAVRNVTGHGMLVRERRFQGGEGDPRVLTLNWEWGRLEALLRQRSAYGAARRQVEQLRARLP
jgi:hypothetical protein